MSALEVIATSTVTTTTTTPTTSTHSFTNIPQTYKHLIVHGYFLNPETIHDGWVSFTQGTDGAFDADYCSSRSGFSEGAVSARASGANPLRSVEVRKNTQTYGGGIPQYFEAWIPFYTQTSANYGTRMVATESWAIGTQDNNAQARWWGVVESRLSYAAVTQLNIYSYPGQTVGDKIILYGLGT